MSGPIFTPQGEWQRLRMQDTKQFAGLVASQDVQSGSDRWIAGQDQLDLGLDCVAGGPELINHEISELVVELTLVIGKVGHSRTRNRCK